MQSYLGWWVIRLGFCVAAAVGGVQITVDGDTSTNDTVIGLASGKSGAAAITDASSQDGKLLEAALTALLQVMCTAGCTCG